MLIPKSMQADVVQRVHAGHQGIEKCKLRAKSCVYSLYCVMHCTFADLGSNKVSSSSSTGTV